MSGYHDMWADGMRDGWDKTDMPIPTLVPDWEQRIPYYKTLIGTFAGKLRTTMLLVLPEAEDKRSGPWPSPRTWEMGAKLLAAAESFGTQKPINDTQVELLSGCVGEGAAGEFIGWLQAANLPDPEALLATPTLFPKIDTGKEHIIYAILSSLLGILQNTSYSDKERNTRWTQGWHVIKEACKYGPDVAFGAFVQPMIKCRPTPRAKAPKEVSDLLVEYGRAVDILPGGPEETK